MLHFPHSQLLFGPSIVVVISGPHIQLVDSRTGDLITTTSDLQGPDKEALLKSGPVRLAAIDKSGTHLVTSGDDKQLKLWQIDGLKLLNERELPKKPTALAFTQDGQTILASDKFGDVFSYELNPAPQSAEEKKAALASHDNPSGGKLILGHTSFLTAFLLSADEKYIITADRDEHVRVSWYPQGYTVEIYCLGHEKQVRPPLSIFVSAIHIPESAPTELISGGGDPMLKVWDWMRGTVKREVPILTAVEPFMKVKPPQKKRFEYIDEEAGDGTKLRGRKAKGRAKHRAKMEAKQGSTSAVDASEDVEAADPPEVADPILVLRRLESVGLDIPYLIFNAVGVTALFSCIYSEDVSPDIDAFDFEQPVIDFVVAADGLIWVTLDGEWSEGGSKGTLETAPLSPTNWHFHQLVEVSNEPITPLLSSLNSKCVLPATTADLKALDLYLALTALPKNNEVEHDPMDREAVVNPEDGESMKEISRKELGRLKSKKAVLAKVQATQPESEERSTKRAKSEHDESTDVVMGEVS
ncbi:WD40 repeat-like protein [Mycena rebaudengoi]|nr:WD40 repeat-like protein [Mycena rebaudengoi]